jgi:regulatory protein
VIQRAAARRGAVSLKGKALQWLSQREHSRLELARKLRRWQAAQARHAEQPAAAGADGTFEPEPEPADPAEAEAAIAQVLDQLASAGLLSDGRFVQSRLHLRQARFGNRRIEQELKQHGVSPSDEQRAELRGSEVERAVQVLKSRFTNPLPPGPAGLSQMQKAQRFLAGRGFSSDAIRAALRQLGEAADPQSD